MTTFKGLAANRLFIVAGTVAFTVLAEYAAASHPDLHNALCGMVTHGAS